VNGICDQRRYRQEFERNDCINNVGFQARVDFRGANFGRKKPNMFTIGCDYHPRFQQIDGVKTDMGLGIVSRPTGSYF